MSKFIKSIASLCMGGLLLLTAQLAHATMTISLVAGASCSGSPPSSAQFSPGGASQQVSLCVTTTTEGLCGFDLNLKAASAGESGRFNIAAQALIANWTANSTSFAFPYPINNPATALDFGATPNSLPAPIAGPATLLLQTLTIAPQATATNGSYVLSTDNNAVYTANGATCDNIDIVPITSTFTFFQPPTITIGAVPNTLTDSAGQVSTVTVTSSVAPPSNLVVNLANSMPAGRATTACGSTITILAGQQTASCTVTATANTVPFDGNVNASVSVAGGTGYAVGAPSTANVAINNNDLPTVSIGASPASIFDSAGNVSTVTVTLGAPAPTGGFAVNLTLPASNPRYNTNCVSPPFFAAGETIRTCTVTAVPNLTVGDGNATATVGIAPNATYTITGTNPVDVTIQDDDIPVMSAVCAPLTLTDSAGQTSTCTISSDKALAAPLTVNLNQPTANARYTTTCGGTIVVPIGAAGTSSTCTISAVANTTIGDGNVTATLSVAGGAGYTVGGTTQNVAINNDDFAAISVGVSPASVAEDSGMPLVYTFTASAASNRPTSILFTPPAASGRYSTTCVSPITLDEDETMVSCTVMPIGNTVLDGPATATVTVLPSAGVYTVGAPSVATGTITDNEIAVGVVTTTPSITEGGTASFTISCQGAANLGTASYSFSGSYVPLPANGSGPLTCGTPLVVSVPTSDDTDANGDRTLILTITGVGAPGVVDPASASATVVVQDNEVIRTVQTIPTMNTLGLMLLGLLLTAAAAFGMRRKA